MPISFELGFPEATILEKADKYPERYAVRDKIACAAGLSGRSRGYLTKEEFVEIAKWKSQRPTRRYESNNKAIVESVTAAALKSANDFERIVLLTELSGVRVRTATVILHVCYPESCPLLDVWAMTSLGIDRDETEKWDELEWLRTYPEYAKFCQSLAQRTSQSLRVIDRSLWVYGEAKGSRRSKKQTAK